MANLALDDLFFYRAKIIMKILGVWVPSGNENKTQKLYKYFMLTFQFMFLLFQVIYVIQVWGDLEAISEAMYLMVTQACLCCKIAVFHTNAEIVKLLLAQMNSDIFKPKNNEQERILKKQAKMIKLLLLFFIVAAETTCCLWGLKPLFDDVGMRKFPFDMWMPVSPDSTVQYLLGFIFQELTICISALMYYGVDSVAISMVIFACAEMEMIMDNITSLKSYKNRDEDVSDLDEYYERGNERLMNCVKHHQAIATFTDSVGEAFHICFLFQLTGAVGLIVMSSFRILVIEKQSMQFVSLIFYLTVMTSQIYLLCLSGHKLTTTSEELRSVFYSCVWYEQDIKFQRAFNFTLMRISRPLVLRAGNYVTLSRQTFLTILRTSYSYIAVLNQTK